MDLGFLYRVVDNARNLGERTLGNGTELVGHVPHVASEAWLHMLFAPIDDQVIEEIERSLELALPSDYACLLRQHNGVRLFSGDIWLGGWRVSFARKGDAIWQPFSVVSANLDNGTLQSDNPELVIGGEEGVGARFRINIKSQQVCKYGQRGKKPLASWDNIEAMLQAEVGRVSRRYDASGHRIK
jgi:hypothetical protein